MEIVQNFVTNYYFWIVIICLFLIFTLIGYLADKKKKEKNIVQEIKSKEEVNKEEVTNEQESKVEEKPKTLEELISQSNMTTVSSINKEENSIQEKVEDDESVNIEPKEEIKTVANNFQPELEEENNSIIVGEEKEDSN